MSELEGYVAMPALLGRANVGGMIASANDPRPPYLQVADVLRQEIRAGKYAPGDRLPSYRELEERFSIANMTARSALRVLREARYIYTVQGRGSFVSETLGVVGELSARHAQGPREAQAPHDLDRLGSATLTEAPAGVQESAGSGSSAEPEASLNEVLRAIREEMRSMNAELQDLKAEVARLSQSKDPGTKPRRPSRKAQGDPEAVQSAGEEPVQS